MHIDNTSNKFKARLVVREFFQIYAIDYTNTFAPIVKFNTLRLFLIIVALKDLKCHQVNVNNVFIESFLKKIIYMKLSSDVKLSLDQTLFICRNLYNLKQAVRN